MILYHTSTIAIDSPDVLHSRAHLDFGKGFQSLIESHLHYLESKQL
jgi:hypothetical protein